MQTEAHSHTKTSTSSKKEFLNGLRDTLPLIIGAIPFGIIFGTLAGSNGLSFKGALAMSLIVFAGSAQFIALGLLGMGVGWLMIVVTTFVVNVRHLLYSATLVPHIKHLSQIWRIPLAFWLTDETFAIVVNRYNQDDPSENKHWYYFGSAVFMYSNWQLCTFIGLTIGQAFPNIANWGLDFAMPVTFIGMVVPYLKNRPMWIAVTVAAAVAFFAHPLPHKLGLMIACLSGIITGVFFESLEEKRKESV